MTLTKRFQDSSQRLITRFGALRNYTHKTEEVYNPDTQTTESIETNLTIKVFKSQPKERELKSPNLVGRETTAMMIAASDLPFSPIVGDTITETYFNTTHTFTVEVVTSNWAGEGVASWRLICTRS